MPKIRTSMDGWGRWMDDGFIEPLWRSLIYECVYLNAFETGSELRVGLTRWIGYYNADRPHSDLALFIDRQHNGVGRRRDIAPPAEKTPNGGMIETRE